MTQSLHGRSALITGASSDPGVYFGRLLAAQGARVVLAARTRPIGGGLRRHNGFRRCGAGGNARRCRSRFITLKL